MSKYTPSTEQVRQAGVATYTYDQFDRWLAQHEQQLREQIAQEIDEAAYTLISADPRVVALSIQRQAANIARKGQDND